ncbi:MAG: hypothetical protein ACFFG0_40320 [Candidatus Thorarchaeota archaeon]
MKKILLICILCLILVGCDREPTKNNEEQVVENSVYYVDLDKINYTTLNITREEFEEFDGYTQNRWVYGDCYPPSCGIRNPPKCKYYFNIYCSWGKGNVSSEEDIYWSNIFIEEKD